MRLWITILIILVLIASGWFLISRRMKDQQQIDLKETEFKEHIIDGVLVSTTLGETHSQNVVSFLKSSLKEAYWPKELALTVVPGPPQEQGYVANWKVDTEIMSLLYVITDPGGELKYIRVWGLTESQPINVNSYRDLSAALFQEDLLDLIVPSCSEDKVSEDVLTQCGGLTPVASGGLNGFTVQSPVFIDFLNQDKTTVTACFIPPQGRDTYASKFCI